MNGVASIERRKTLKERLGLNGFGCCGAHLGLGHISVLDEESPLNEPMIPAPAETSSTNSCDLHVPVAAQPTGMNLAMALAVERQFRATQDSDESLSPVDLEISGPNSGPIGTPSRMSLMRLLHETEGEDSERENKEKVAEVGNDSVCCVCMGRKKGAAFIPCGHTFCRVCSRELWLNRGSCPLCNRPIFEILDIF